MLRGAGATPAAKRTQRACRLRDRAPKAVDAESTSLRRRKTTSPFLKWPGFGGPPGSKSGACTQGSPRNLVSSSPPMRGGAGAAVEVVQALGEPPAPEGTKEGEAVVVLSEGNEVKRDGRREVGVG